MTQNGVGISSSLCGGLLGLCTLSCLLAPISYQDSDNKETAFISTISRLTVKLKVIDEFSISMGYDVSIDSTTAFPVVDSLKYAHLLNLDS
jgi:hypothetical protein